MIYNTHLIIDSNGVIISEYRKMHLFDVDIPSKGVKMNESKVVKGGNDLVVCDSPVGKLGLSICYDLRFPELYLSLRRMDAQILLLPSAFMKSTGEAHWKPLLQAREIENQTYVIATAQIGDHHSKRSSYGHSMIIDPWGKVLHDLPDNVNDIAFVDIDLDYISTCRENIPVVDDDDDDDYNNTNNQTTINKYEIFLELDYEISNVIQSENPSYFILYSDKSNVLIVYNIDTLSYEKYTNFKIPLHHNEKNAQSFIARGGSPIEPNQVKKKNILIPIFISIIGFSVFVFLIIITLFFFSLINKAVLCLVFLGASLTILGFATVKVNDKVCYQEIENQNNKIIDINNQLNEKEKEKEINTAVQF
ncbi:hypothetical protein ACTFIZ_008911 [Dictyostelium cf. discoideum]